MPPPPEHLVQALVDRYRIERELGAGGMATVYLAEDLKHHRQVAIKVLRPDLAAAIGADRFLREITTTANLRHPHILPLYDSGSLPLSPEGEVLFYVMPFVDGESLRDRLRREKQLPLDDALRIAREVADALSYAHAHGVVHRDIKPENILLESDHAVVADFGIAKALTAVSGETLTRTGVAIGTPQYMSPEQAAGGQDVDGRSDLYSLACVLYEMLTSQPPFTGPSAESVVRQHMVVTARPVSELRPAVPPAIADVLTRALAKNPADRFSPAAHFAAALVPPASAGARSPTRLSPRAIGVAALVLFAAVVAIVGLGRRSSGERAIAIGHTTQVTREPGLEVDPALSPDGASLAYAAGPPSAMQIYVRQVSGGRPLALTSDTTGNYRWPRWSPDGAQIAYEANDGIYVVPALGGTPRRVIHKEPSQFRFGTAASAPIAGFDWSPDGSRIAWALGYNGNGVTVATLASGDTVTLASPEAPFSPAWAPDGKRIAIAAGNNLFVFGSGYFANDGTSGIWVVHLDGSPPTAVTPDSAMNAGPLWSPDGRELYWVSDRDGSRDVYRQRIAANGAPEGTPRRLTTGTDAQGISLSRSGGRLAYSRLSTWSSIYAIAVPRRAPVSIRGATRITTGNETIEDVDISPDGRWLTYDSDRNGNFDIYVMPAAGGEPRQITTDKGADFNPKWSPDGRRIVFHSLRNGNRDVYSVQADGTGLERWTSGSAEELDPAWAPDGETIQYEVLGGARQAHGFVIQRGAQGAPRFIPIAGGDFGRWRPVGRAFVYHAPDGLRLHDVDSGVDTLIVSNDRDGATAFYAAWSPDGATLYYLARTRTGWSIRSVPARGGTGTVLVQYDDPARQQTKFGFSTDGKMFYVTLGSPQSDIYVADLERATEPR